MGSMGSMTNNVKQTPPYPFLKTNTFFYFPRLTVQSHFIDWAQSLGPWGPLGPLGPRIDIKKIKNILPLPFPFLFINIFIFSRLTVQIHYIRLGPVIGSIGSMGSMKNENVNFSRREKWLFSERERGSFVFSRVSYSFLKRVTLH